MSSANKSTETTPLNHAKEPVARPAAKASAWKTGALPGWESGTPQKPDEMAPETLEFIKALDTYKDKYGRQYPSWSEVLGILLALGYRKVAKPQ